jgi:5-deoxy-D-glucuronate isomerase
VLSPYGLEIVEDCLTCNIRLASKLITPREVASSLREGGNVSRQIVDVITPAFPADKLMMIEVDTPGENWSSYPPHKHVISPPPRVLPLVFTACEPLDPTLRMLQ